MWRESERHIPQAGFSKYQIHRPGGFKVAGYDKTLTKNHDIMTRRGFLIALTLACKVGFGGEKKETRKTQKEHKNRFASEVSATSLSFVAAGSSCRVDARSGVWTEPMGISESPVSPWVF